MRCTELLAVAMTALFSSPLIAGLSNFIVTNSAGIVYEVDSQTLQATQITELNAFSNLNEICYEGNNSLLYIDGTRIVRHNILTAQESLVMNTYQGVVGANVSAGLDITDDGDLFYTVNSTGPGISTTFAVTANETTGHVYAVEREELTVFFDHLMVDENLFISAAYTRHEIYFTNSLTGTIDDRFAIEPAIASFIESDAGIFAMTVQGELHQVDLENRTTSYYGQISGTTGNLLGATVPAPGSVLLIGLATGAYARKRRVG